MPTVFFSEMAPFTMYVILSVLLIEYQQYNKDCKGPVWNNVKPIKDGQFQNASLTEIGLLIHYYQQVIT